MEILVKSLRVIVFKLDELVYNLIGLVYGLFSEIAGANIFNSVIDQFNTRIYALLGIFMLFKISFSILSYVVNPDDFTDKSKGAGKLVGNVVITLTLLVLTPWAFEQAYDLQRIILKDNVIPNLILGVKDDSMDGNSVVEDSGRMISYETLKAFYYLDETEYPDCAGIYSNALADSNFDAAICKESLNDKGIDGDLIVDTIITSKSVRSVNLYLDYGIMMARDSNGNFVMTYRAIVSTVVGVIINLLLITFCFDIAVRGIKLGLLQLIAPIPIITRIDPKKGKDGMFSKWLKTTVTTYLDLFVRLLAIYFALLIVTLVVDSSLVNVVTNEKITNPLVIAFVILGALLFAKQLPTLITDLTGMKVDGKFTLNPLKKLSTVPVAGAATSLTAGGIDSALHGNGFFRGIKRNWGNVPLAGGDGKKTMFDTVDRKLRQDINKKRDITNYEGIKDFEDIDSKWDKGEEIRLKLKENKLDFSSFDGSNSKAYDLAYKNKEFKNSAMSMDKADNKAKAFAKAYAMAQAQGAAFTGWTYGGKKYEVTNIDELYEDNESAQKALKGKEAVHDTMRKKYSDDAARQDAIKFRKYNADKPTVDKPTV